MNLIEQLKEEVNAPNVGGGWIVAIIENYFQTTACSRGWTMDEFCSWLEDNFKGDY